MARRSAKQAANEPRLAGDAPRLRLTGPGGDGKAHFDGAVPVITVGGRRDCHLALTHPDISKIHAAIVQTGRGIVVRDLLSRSGTFVDGDSVDRRVLRPGEALRFGPVEVGVDFIGKPPITSDDIGDFSQSVILEGPDGRVRIETNAFVIGRRSAADLMIDHPDVSLAHAMVFELNGRPAICDLGSRSGTYLNDERISVAWLRDGDEVAFGTELFTVCWEGEGAIDQVAEPENTAAVAGPAVPPPAPPAATPPALPVAAPPPATASPTPPVAPAETAPTPRAAPPAMPQISLPEGGADLADLEQSIAAVHSQISVARTRIDECNLQLDQREAALREREEAVAAQAADLEQRAAAIVQQEASAAAMAEQAAQRSQAVEEQEARLAAEQVAADQLRSENEQHSADLAQQEQALAEQREVLTADRAAFEAARNQFDADRQVLDQSLADCHQREQDLEQKADELDASAARLSADMETLEQERAELTQAQAALAEAQQAVAAQEQGFAERESALNELSRQLDERTAETERLEETLATRKAELDGRQAEHEDALRRIESFRTALAAASETLTQRPTEAPPPPAAAEESAPTTEEAAKPAEAEELPAPVVEAPMFGSSGAVPPTNWPPELRERFHVLRRVSGKSDEELMAQVWGDREKVLNQRSSSGGASRKKKRRLWGN